MGTDKIDLSELLKEKNLWQIYRASQSIPDSKFNWIIGMVVALLFGLYGAFDERTLSLQLLLLKIGDIGINVSVSILGFLIAGFTIFATLTKSDLVMLLAKKTHPKTGLSYLKYNYFTFIRTFIYFLAFNCFQLVVVTLGQENGLSHILANFRQYQDAEPYLSYFSTRGLLSLSAGFFAFVMLQLKSFIFNIYHVIMTTVQFEAITYNTGITEISGLRIERQRYIPRRWVRRNKINKIG